MTLNEKIFCEILDPVVSLNYVSCLMQSHWEKSNLINGFRIYSALPCYDRIRYFAMMKLGCKWCERAVVQQLHDAIALILTEKCLQPFGELMTQRIKPFQKIKCI